MKKLKLLVRACIIPVLGVVMTTPSHAQTLTTLHTFNGTDGGSPTGLVQTVDGSLYGTTGWGGTSSNCGVGVGCGTIFQIAPSGTLTTLHTFDGTDGSGPNVLIQGSDGKLYGTTAAGGTSFPGLCNGLGCGTVFSIIPGGTPTILYNFCSQANCVDGFDPVALLVQGSDGNFYGTTSDNDQPQVCIGTCGTIFKITPTGTLTSLYSFDGTSGYGPMAGLVQGSDGDFYGTTAYGGSSNCGSGQAGTCGTVFKITTSGVLTTIYSFCLQMGCSDGYNASGLLLGADGNFYGTTLYGGGSLCSYGTCGTVFKITPEGALTTLHAFNGGDGAQPRSGLIQGSDGNFYGITSGGGANNYGTIFKMTPAGTLITLHNFGGSDGLSPTGLLQAADGTFYGTTAGSSANIDGTIFSFSVGLGGTEASTTNLSLSPSSVTLGSAGPVTMTATVTPTSGSGTPTGVVAFFNGSDEVGFANLSAGVATYNYNPDFLAVDTYQITAIYNGDGTFATSTSSAQTLVVTSLPSAATPTFSPAAGTYSSGQAVTITDATAGASIYFTTDGSIPTTGSEIYNGAITVNSKETIQAIAAASGYSLSPVASATYTINSGADYQFSVTPSSLTIATGQSGTATFTITPMGGFSSQVTFACSGLPSESTCTFAPSSVTPSGGNPVSSTLTLSTTAASAAFRGAEPPLSPLTYAVLVSFVGMIICVASTHMGAAHRSRALGMLLIGVLAVALSSCGGSKMGNPGTPIGTSTVTVSASTSGTGGISHTTTLVITITK